MDHTLNAFISAQALPKNYALEAAQWFDPLLPTLTEQSKHHQPLMLAINGCQGSGKTTLAAYLTLRLSRAGLYVLNLSLDDFYLGKAERSALAQAAHPLFATRGVPGTHDLPQMQAVLTSLKAGETGMKLPRFSKAEDDRLPIEQWPLCEQKPDLVIMEGWCWGARAVANDALAQPLNALERDEDAEGVWRQHVNTALRQYEALYPLMNAWMMLRAPGFDCVAQWRTEQEQKLIARLKQAGQTIPASVMDEAAIKRFVAHYQRLTERLLRDLPEHADIVWQLDAQRRIEQVQTRGMFQDFAVTKSHAS